MCSGRPRESAGGRSAAPGFRLGSGPAVGSVGAVRDRTVGACGELRTFTLGTGNEVTEFAGSLAKVLSDSMGDCESLVLCVEEMAAYGGASAFCQAIMVLLLLYMRIMIQPSLAGHQQINSTFHEQHLCSSSPRLLLRIEVAQAA